MQSVECIFPCINIHTHGTVPYLAGYTNWYEHIQCAYAVHTHQYFPDWFDDTWTKIMHTISRSQLRNIVSVHLQCVYIYIKKELALPFVLNLLKTNPRTLNPHQTLCDVILNGLMFYRKAIFLKSRHKQCCDYSKPDRLILLLYHIKNPFRHLVNYINSLPSLLHA